jgi:hypothetical protein
LNLAVNSTTTSSTDVTICPNQLPYNWNGSWLQCSRNLHIHDDKCCRMWFSCNLELAVNSTTTSITDVTICPNQLPYNWNGTDYTAAGTYTFTTTNSAGCDSVATLNLAVNSTTTSTTDVTICPNQLPYHWNGTDYTAPGTYTFTTTNAAGCDSVASLNLAVNSTTTSTTDVTICPNLLPYSWNGTDYTIAGTYTFTTTNAAGCDSVATLNLSVNSTRPRQLMLRFVPTNYLITGTELTIRYAGLTRSLQPNAAGCDSVATLNLAVNSTTTSTTDVTICPNQLPYNWNGTDYMQRELTHSRTPMLQDVIQLQPEPGSQFDDHVNNWCYHLFEPITL